MDDAYAELKKAKEIDLANVRKDPTGKTREQMLPAAAIMARFYDEYLHSTSSSGGYPKSKQAEDLFKYALEHSPDDLMLRSGGDRVGFEQRRD